MADNVASSKSSWKWQHNTEFFIIEKTACRKFYFRARSIYQSRTGKRRISFQFLIREFFQVSVVKFAPLVESKWNARLKWLLGQKKMCTIHWRVCCASSRHWVIPTNHQHFQNQKRKMPRFTQKIRKLAQFFHTWGLLFRKNSKFPQFNFNENTLNTLHIQQITKG